MKRKLISIILPVYNVENYLRRSLDSIFCQDTSDCEILLINDGSKDLSLDILREYEREHSNVRVIDKANEGVSETRNLGLEECNGEYFYFMDADDMLHPQLLSLLRYAITSSNPDIVVWDFVTFYSKPRYAEITLHLNVEKVGNDSKEAFGNLMAKGSAVSLWNKAIRRSLIGEIVRLDPTMTYGEDMFFSWKSILLAKDIVYIHEPLYYYRQSGRGATNRFHPSLYEHYREAFDDMRRFIMQNNMYVRDVLESVDYHFACRLPSLVRMETRAPYSKEEQRLHLAKILGDESIQRGLSNNKQLDEKLYVLARNGKVEQMLNYARWGNIKEKILFPIKKILK